MRIDLHMHTRRSDGQPLPSELAAVVDQLRLVAWAITDHDTLAGYREVADARNLIAGVEVTAEHQGREVHVVGLGIDPDDEAFGRLLARIRDVRLERADQLLAHAGTVGWPRLSVDEARDPEAQIVSRLHLARALARCKPEARTSHLFDGVLDDESVRKLDLVPFPTISSVAEGIRAAGGVALLAHPGIYGNINLIEQLVGEGLDGLEVSHPHLDPSLKALMEGLATSRGLLMSCGSDSHDPQRRPLGSNRLSRAQARPLLQRLGWKDPVLNA